MTFLSLHWLNCYLQAYQSIGSPSKTELLPEESFIWVSFRCGI